jgi:hypothetical protein
LRDLDLGVYWYVILKTVLKSKAQVGVLRQAIRGYVDMKNERDSVMINKLDGKILRKVEQ